MHQIEAKNLQMTYVNEGVETPALRGVSFVMEKGEFVAIMGPSGSGKSTLLHILGFLERPSKGEYRFNGKQLADYTDDELAAVRNEEMGFVFQAFNLLARATVFENVKLPLLYSKVHPREWDRRAREAIDIVGLLDSKSGGVIMETLARLNRERKHTIILITHETYTAGYAERVIRLHDGAIEEDAKVERRNHIESGFVK
ncbi:MAG: Macrolide-specific efflux protein MacB [Parcubacteria group bacterium GW2011_GWB1_50_9]|nr:MAG: Macrolide-specific efflux protein MacB [Parcubacteria group bacterium GW2011_GWB1_50_9]